MIASFLCVIALSVFLALRSREKNKGSAHDFFVAGGQLGSVLVFFLSVGETYSVASMLGFPGGVFAKGDAFSAWFFGYILLISPVVSFVGPWIWRAGAVYQSATIPDFFRDHFSSRGLEVFMAASSILLLVPIGTMQFMGLKIVLTSLAPGISPLLLSGCAGAMAFAYVAIAGLRASAYVAVLKDVLMIVAIVAVGGAALTHWHTAQPQILATAQPTSMSASEIRFVITTVLLQSVAYAMIPQTWAFVFSARSTTVLTRSQIAAPLYMLMFPLLMLSANYALTHSLRPPTPDHVFLTTSSVLMPGWVHGLVLAAVTLSGLVLLSSVCLAIGPLVSRNILSNLSGASQRNLTKGITAGYLILSIIGAEMVGNVIATLNNIFYFGVAQTLPGFAAALWSRRTSAAAVTGGILVGDLMSLALFMTKADTFGINYGLVGLIPNVVVMMLVTQIWPRRDARTVLEKIRGRAIPAL